MIFLSDYIKSNLENSELDAILAEIKSGKYEAEKEAESPAKTWSIDDIDKLIAETNGEEYVPPVKEEKLTPAEDFTRILSREFDTGIFTVRPMEEPVAENEDATRDISSVSADAEVEGQEMFYDKNDSFDESLFEIETVIVPEDEPEEDKTAKYLRASEEETQIKQTTHEIQPFYEGEKSAPDFFKKEEKEEKSTGEVIDYRTRFFTKLQLENTAEVDIEPDGPVDKPGVVVSKNGFSTETGLELMPKVRAAEDVARELAQEKTIVIGAASSQTQTTREKVIPESDDVEGQIVLTGFEDIPAEILPEQTSETDVEENLWKKRKQKARDFKLVDAVDLDEDFEGNYEISPEERAREERARKREQRKLELEKEQQAMREKPVPNEYTSPSERTRIYTHLRETSKRATMNIIYVAVIEFAFIIFNIIPSISSKLSIESDFFATGSQGLNVLNAVLLIAAVALHGTKFANGFKSLFARNVTGDSVVSLSVAVAFVQNTIAAVIAPDDMGSAVFSAAAIFAILLAKISEKLDAKRILSNFEVLAFKYEHNMYAVHNLDNESEIFELGRGLMMGNADLLYSSQVSFAEDFMKNSKADASGNRFMRILVAAAAGASLITAVAAGVVNESATVALSAFAATFCVCAPVFSTFIPAFVARTTNFSLNPTGTVITGIGTAEQTSCANAVVLDSADIFDRSRCMMHGMKDFKNIRIDDVLLYAAALVIKSGGPLRESFEQVVDGRQDILPPVKELVYEDKLGITARIHNQKILLGNRSLLVHHNVEVPDKSVEEKYSHSGRKVMYLAVAGKLAALFVVSYAVDKNLEGYFRMLESNGIQVLVRTNDVNITEELISKSFGLPLETFKVLSSTAGRLFKRRRDAVCDKLPAGIIHDGTAFSMLRAVAASCSISSKCRLATIVQIVLSVLGFGLITALYCTGLGTAVNALTSVLFLAAGSLISAGIMMMGKIK